MVERRRGRMSSGDSWDRWQSGSIISAPEYREAQRRFTEAINLFVDRVHEEFFGHTMRGLGSVPEGTIWGTGITDCMLGHAEPPTADTSPPEWSPPLAPLPEWLKKDHIGEITKENKK
jgi:hypothetical protein